MQSFWCTFMSFVYVHNRIFVCLCVCLYVCVFVYSNWNVQAIKTNEANYYTVNMSACLCVCVRIFACHSSQTALHIFAIPVTRSAIQPATTTCLIYIYFAMFIFPFGHLIIFVKCICCRCINYCIRGTIRGKKASEQANEKSVQFSMHSVLPRERMYISILIKCLFSFHYIYDLCGMRFNMCCACPVVG